ncbi:9312_t:CDS:10 [Funneliformis caledonium]|uniref:9312_t:CDS:1 n=1 Tax=Funneliformis caledonium TaxID=1117310 RepID=A0A9N9HCJ8_9GLOM|nr:9312_t:CDS:10 [Funneliformis caledonium]
MDGNHKSEEQERGFRPAGEKHSEAQQSVRSSVRDDLFAILCDPPFAYMDYDNYRAPWNSTVSLYFKKISLKNWSHKHFYEQTDIIDLKQATLVWYEDLFTIKNLPGLFLSDKLFDAIIKRKMADTSAVNEKKRKFAKDAVHTNSVVTSAELLKCSFDHHSKYTKQKLDVSGDDEQSEGKEDQSPFSQKQNDMTPKRKPEDVEEEDDIYYKPHRTAPSSWRKQILLRYNIIDTIGSSATNARRLFEDIWETMVIAMEEVPSISITKDDKIKNYTKELFMGVNSLEKLREAIKSNRSTLRTSGNTGWKRQIIKISKIFRDQFENGKNSFKEKQTEYQYIINFIAPIYKIMFKDLLHLSFDWGEKALKCSAILLNKSQRDNDRRSPGSKIDTIIKLMELNLEFSIVEVAGSPSDPDHSHYVGDRNKIAKNLKIILNYIRTEYSGDFQQFRKIKVYGVQIYSKYYELDSLSLPFSGVYYFKQEFMFECPTITLLVSKALPKFLDNLWRIRDIISSSIESITSYIENMRESDDGSNDTDPVTISPKKQRQK